MSDSWERDQPSPKSMVPLLLMLAVLVALSTGLAVVILTGTGQ